MNPLDQFLLSPTLDEEDKFIYPWERFCSTGQHWLPETSFRVLEHGKLARDCKRCEAARQRRNQQLAAQRLPMTGVDIDRIHYKLRRVK